MLVLLQVCYNADNMSDQTPFSRPLMAINKNEQVRKLRTFGDKLADWVTAVAGSTGFLMLNVAWFAGWILLNTGFFGPDLIFDEYPFGFLTMVVSLEAIILSVFVLISQNRQSERSEIKADLDYITDLRVETENTTMLLILERIAAEHKIDISDLLQDLEAHEKKIIRDHHIDKKQIDN